MISYDSWICTGAFDVPNVSTNVVLTFAVAVALVSSWSVPISSIRGRSYTGVPPSSPTLVSSCSADLGPSVGAVPYRSMASHRLEAQVRDVHS